MFSHWPIRKKLGVVIALLVTTLVALAYSSFQGVYAFRSLARGISQRGTELPLGLELAKEVSALESIFADTETHEDGFITGYRVDSGHRLQIDFLNVRFNTKFEEVTTQFNFYRSQIEQNIEKSHIADKKEELATVLEFQQHLDDIAFIVNEIDWENPDESQLLEIKEEVGELNKLSSALPGYLSDKMSSFADDVRLQYRALIVLTATTSILAAALSLIIARMFYRWIFQPLKTLINGSRRVAAGEFDHRIQLESKDEMAELGSAMNHMTSSFQEIRDDLDEQVRQRTREVVRGEQLASVGFLAAGVAHEINNPLQSIALCSESLEERLHDILPADASDGSKTDKEVDGMRNYLRMIQEEAFRCKQITERLLDFSRMGEAEKQPTDLNELVSGVIDMVRHLGKYKQKSVAFSGGDPIVAAVNPQEMKQVVLNLITNGLESLRPGGEVVVELIAFGPHAKLIVQDNGCGMTEEVMEHLFEPFFTRRQDGQGTGLGMSISYRIINEHDGQIDVYSDGPGTGSTITVWLPRMQTKEMQPSLQRRLAA